MNVSGILYTKLSGESSVTAICSTRIYPYTIPQKPDGSGYPAATITVISNEPSDTKTEASTLDAWRVQIDCYAKTALSALQLDNAIRAAIDRFRGTVTVTGDAAYFVDGIRYENTNEIMEPEKDIFRRSTDYQIRLHRN